MKAVVLAGGLRSGTEVPGSGLPRALWPFPHLPLITHVLQFLKGRGCESLAICANGKTKLIASELSNAAQPWTGLHYSEDVLPRGPAGCLRDLQDWLGAGDGSDPFVVIQATGSYDFDLAALVEEHRRTGAAITVGARRCPDDPELLEPAGVYVVEPWTLSLVSAVGYQDFKEQLIPRVLGAGGRVRCHMLRGRAALIHSPGHYLSALRDAILQASQAETLLAGYREISARPENPVIAHESAKIHSSARISGPVWIDAGVEVGEGAVISGPVVLSPESRVGAQALLHRAVALRGAIVAPHAEAFSSILAPHSLLGAPARVSRPRIGADAPARERARESGWAQRLWGLPRRALGSAR